MARSVTSCDANSQRKKSKWLDICSLGDDFAGDRPRCVGAMPRRLKLSRRESRCNRPRLALFRPQEGETCGDPCQYTVIPHDLSPLRQLRDGTMADMLLRMTDGTQIAVPASLDAMTTYVILEQETWFEK